MKANRTLILNTLLIVILFVSCQSDPKEIIGKPIYCGDGIEVAEKRFPKQMNREDASAACKALGKGWRLPNIGELMIIEKRLRKNHKFHNETYETYWSSTDYEKHDDNFAYVFSFPSYTFWLDFTYNKHYVYAVRSF
jgi:hypothetical protein